MSPGVPVAAATAKGSIGVEVEETAYLDHGTTMAEMGGGTTMAEAEPEMGGGTTMDKGFAAAAAVMGLFIAPTFPTPLDVSPLVAGGDRVVTPKTSTLTLTSLPLMKRIMILKTSSMTRMKTWMLMSFSLKSKPADVRCFLNSGRKEQMNAVKTK